MVIRHVAVIAMASLIGANAVQAQENCAELETLCYLGAIDLGRDSEAAAVSADGSVVVGYSGTSSGGRAFRWTSSEGMLNLGVLPSGNFSTANDVSGDGAVIVGSGLAGGFRAWRWTAQDGMTLFLPGTNSSSAYGVSDDGLVIVGQDNSLAFRWSAADGMTDLGLFDGDGRSEARATNADGSVVVGHSMNSNNGQSRAFRWTAQDGKVQIGGLYTFAFGVSADGAVVVGSSDSYAYRWTQDGGIQSLGALAGGTNSFAYDISADGTTIVGSSEAADGRFAFRWTEQDQMVSLGVLDGGVESYAYGVSGDGSVVVGYSETTDGDYRAFLWRSGAIQDHSNLIASFPSMAAKTELAFASQQAGLRDVMESRSFANGAGRSVIGLRGGVNNTGVTKGLGGHSALSGAMSYGYGLSDQMTLGFAVSANGDDASGSGVDLSNGFGAATWGEYSQGGAMRSGWQGSFALGYARQNAAMTRGLGFDDVEAALGNSALATRSALIEISYADRSVNGLVLTPKLGIAHADMSRDAYAESAEATVFNAHYDSAKTSVTVAKLGVTGEWQFPDDHSLSIGAGANFDLNVADLTLTGSSNIPGMDTFIAPSPLSRHQLRPFVTASYSVNVGDSATFTASARAGRATFGDTPELGIGLRYAVHF